ncbi:MAG: HEPN domain-containing protein [Nitrospira sp. SB0677_bin_15]|nr:HEPN domain-containing protein [Nitrospira sp. SB0667_bin_9]MYD31406.1 HEPN domain-containing protein [Nitrospira sp. SB0661_bin_20]MYG41234.1 HEPN domain-containing protein [Nitrospira sp. SB0677_bin_15]MYH01972.1 HEPN domain-containing protein [Nitrospira sp. SB0675_bin_23]MYJ23845.1 HEPN domain-containing protein [Nitrospira sp. SB0673_bin_12]
MSTGRSTTFPEIHTLPIPQEIQEEIETFEDEVKRLQTGDVTLDLFKPFRLQYGIYGQRQADVQMVRIKIPFGGMTSNQVRRVAELAETYATGVGHVTTRQDIQLHFVPLPQVSTVMRKLEEVGLTTREACANTVRNVTACHLAGVCQGEVFDVTPYANTVARHLLRNPLNQSLPRKFKIAFSGCNHDCAMTPIHDVGLLAKKAEDGTIGFRMVVGGGLGAAPRIAHLLREFVPMDDLIPSIEAVIKVFDNLGNRKNRSKARMKFVIEKLGFEEFKRRWEAAYEEMFGAKPMHPPMKLLPHADPAPLIMPAKNGGNGNGGHPDEAPVSAFATWCRTNVVKQRQDGFSAAVLRLPTGDITAGQMLVVADLAERYSNGNVRTTIGQNLIIRWVGDEQLEAFHEELNAHGLAQPGANKTEDIVACPGTDTCGLGITSSKGVARALAEVFPPGQVPEDLKGTTIHISGCHNSCAQHHISTIGLHGVGKRVGNHVAPVYELHLGGRVNGTAEVGHMTIKLPAKNVPAAVSHLLDVYRRDRQEGESLHAFLKRTGKNALKEELIGHSILPSFDDDPSYYFDWEAEEEFTLEDLGPGECAGGAIEMIDNRILEAEQELYQARILAEKHQYAMAINKAYRAVVAGAKALLVTEGIDPNTDADTLAEFDQFADRQNGLIPQRYRGLARTVSDLGTKDNSSAFTNPKMAFAKGFVEHCRKLTEAVGEDLKLGLAEEGPAATEPAQAESAAQSEPVQDVTVLDLRGVMCPLNYVKTKLKLEMMDEGERLEVWLDAGEPIKNVPMSLRNDGHKVLGEDPLEADEQHFKVLVEKVES